MDIMVGLHVVAGTVGLAAGYVALAVAKGGTVHRRAGLVFVATMLAMALSGGLVAAMRDVAVAINLPAAGLTIYLVATSLHAVRPIGRGTGFDRIACVAGALLVLASYGWAAEALIAGGRRTGLAFPALLFGTVAAVGVAGDLRVLRDGPLRGAARLVRHLWRMGFALFVGSLAFFVGQADRIPVPAGVGVALRFVPLLVLALIVYWTVRTRRGARARRAPRVAREAGAASA